MSMACKVCGFVGDYGDFPKDRSRPSGYRNICKLCWAAKARTYRSDNPERALRIAKRSTQKKDKHIPGLSYKEKREILDDIKRSRACYFCQEDEPVALDFHHRDPNEKDFTVSAEIHKTINQLLEEVAKCEVICANCHRKIHAALLKF